MRARTILVLAVLTLALGAQPLAADGPVIFQRDGTFFYSLHAELNARAAATEESDSTEAPKLVAIAGGASLAGLAAYFIASSGSGTPGGSGFPNLPLNDPSGGGITIPPPEQSSPALPATPTGGGAPGSDAPGGVTSLPTTTAPEPVTMTLLATGLAGMGAAQLKRRRRG
jgi:hypothetical protein